MKATLRFAATAAVLILTATACSAGQLETDEEIASYGLGYGFATNLLMQTEGLELDLDALLAGVRAGFEGAESEVSQERLDAAIEVLGERQMAQQRQLEREQAESARDEGRAFLAENAERDGVEVSESGLQYEILSSTDTGRSPSAQDTVRVHYHGTRIDGEVFDSSVERGQPAEFPLGSVISGWTEGVQLMSEGDRYKFYLPADLAYGDSSPSPAIPPGSTLIFEVELLEVLD
ncbi:FKBP-type peptidyl-prolyl cis-trans isomerase [Thioalkalivibrio nitratireducens DSM 14787]|uniref:Peptidyl-prolyl cis-trans isomerase n=1 Tax=Thioalkalivibrio nitratireducens (strain DSM 14787 / UNIQEM 213 / ALEN2) TaxID=1255043 RepID=L0E0E2_THIND|nr:FKBP-type peptidyl-prolyl cis-trans isomerase [Thioalkalivibrio nitratireducens]AGA34680.1 FKBP-type peptidyl-prolyl cis-trans isomerase [Thioalkalivibrio nitratireducens DSM 14787]